MPKYIVTGVQYETPANPALLPSWLYLPFSMTILSMPFIVEIFQNTNVGKNHFRKDRNVFLLHREVRFHILKSEASGVLVILCVLLWVKYDEWHSHRSKAE